MIFKYIILFTIFNITKIFSYIPNANFVIHSEQKTYNKILDAYKLPCHLQTARVKSFESSIEKMKKKNTKNIYDLYDLIGFRFVFYTHADLLTFYHHFKLEKMIFYSHNYISQPKENGYSSMHIRYKNNYKNCPIKQLECQLYIINDYYDALYGKAKRMDKNYTLYF